MKYRPVSADYFKTMGIPVLRGRAFDVRGNEDGPLVVIINETMARSFWKQQNPIGQRVAFSESKWRTVVGIVGDVHHESLGSKPDAEMYVPYAQVPNVEARPTVVLRTSTEPTKLTGPLRKAIAEVDPHVPVDRITTIKQMISASVGQPRFRTAVIGTLALLALFVASIGLYGVMNHVVSQRIREFGIRMALGASKGAVLRQVLGQAARLVSLGMSFGWLGAILLARWIAGLLYGVTPFDAATFASVSVVLAIVRRCNVRTCPSLNRPGCACCRCSKIVFACNPGSTASNCRISSQYRRTDQAGFATYAFVASRLAGADLAGTFPLSSGPCPPSPLQSPTPTSAQPPESLYMLIAHHTSRLRLSMVFALLAIGSFNCPWPNYDCPMINKPEITTLLPAAALKPLTRPGSPLCRSLPE